MRAPDAAGTEAPLELAGGALDPGAVVRVAREGVPVELAPVAWGHMAAARSVIERYLAEGHPAYGLTTGLGGQVTHRLAAEDLDEFSRRTILGRAHGVGAPLSTEEVRALLVVRANGLATGRPGASPRLAQALVDLLNSRVHPIVREAGSAGNGDLCLLAPVGLVVMGLGEADHDGERLDGGEALARAGLAPLDLGPKDGLALVSTSAGVAGCGALALVDLGTVAAVAQAAAALSMEGFRANLSPLDPRAVAARPQPGQDLAAAGLRRLLAGSELTGTGAARRLQDPLSLRCVSQVHGSLYAALDLLAAALQPELDGGGDNPLVLAGDDEVLSTGNFHLPALAMAADAVALGVAQVANLSVARAARLLSPGLSELPPGLSPRGAGHSGLHVLLKVGDAVAGEIRHLATPVCHDARPTSAGVEDDATDAAYAVRRLSRLVHHLRRLLAMELVVAAQAVDLARPGHLGRGARSAYDGVRSLVRPLDEDRPLGPELEALADALATGDLLGDGDGAAGGPADAATRDGPD